VGCRLRKHPFHELRDTSRIVVQVDEHEPGCKARRGIVPRQPLKEGGLPLQTVDCGASEASLQQEPAHDRLVDETLNGSCHPRFGHG